MLTHGWKRSNVILRQFLLHTRNITTPSSTTKHERLSAAADKLIQLLRTKRQQSPTNINENIASNNKPKAPPQKPQVNANADSLFDKIQILPSVPPTPKNSSLSTIIYRPQFPTEMVLASLPKKIVDSKFKNTGEYSLVRWRPILDVKTKFNFTPIDLSCKQEYVGGCTDDEIPRLAHNLEQVIETGALHVVNHKTPKFLRRVHQPEEINFNSMNQFIPASQDAQLRELSKKHKAKYIGSSSSLTSSLAILYFVMSNHKPTNANRIPSFESGTPIFTPAARKPCTFVLSPHEGGIYSIDSFKYPTDLESNVLLQLGKSMERMLCMEPEEFERRYLIKYNNREFEPEPESYRFTKLGKFLMRSQLDCFSNKIKGESKIFDIKTRATFPIRIDVKNYINARKEQVLDNITGKENSFEREFYDMIRSVFIKYSLQARIGQMHGMFIAYHDTLNIYGFEYVTRNEIDQYVFGAPHIAEKCFVATLGMLEKLCDLLTDRFGSQQLKVTMFANKIAPYCVDIYVEPVFDSSQLTSVEISNNHTIYSYFLKCKVFVNGTYCRDFLHFQKDDKIEVVCSIEEHTDSTKHDFLIDEYRDIMRHAMMLKPLDEAETRLLKMYQ